MLGYIEKALQHFGHSTLQQPQISPHPQFPVPSKPLDGERKRYVQVAIGMLLYYTWAVDPMMLVVLNAIAMQQVAPMHKTLLWVKQL